MPVLRLLPETTDARDVAGPRKSSRPRKINVNVSGPNWLTRERVVK
jgi:hypothetical protein